MKHPFGLMASSLLTLSLSAATVLAVAESPQDLHTLPDPQTLADDICWVAPEWRDND